MRGSFIRIKKCSNHRRTSCRSGIAPGLAIHKIFQIIYTNAKMDKSGEGQKASERLEFVKNVINETRVTQNDGAYG